MAQLSPLVKGKIFRKRIAGEDIEAGQIVCVKDQKYYLAKADDSTLNEVKGIAVNESSADQPLNAIIRGIVEVPASLTVGHPYFLSSVLGEVATAESIPVGAYTVFIGIADTTTTMYVDFSSYDHIGSDNSITETISVFLEAADLDALYASYPATTHNGQLAVVGTAPNVDVWQSDGTYWRLISTWVGSEGSSERFFYTSGLQLESLLKSQPVPASGWSEEFSFFEAEYFGGTVEWNTSSLLKTLDFTGTYFNINQSGVMISPTCFLSTHHYPPSVGQALLFNDAAGNVYSRTVKQREVMSRPSKANDRNWVISLESAVPAGVAVYKLPPVLPNSVMEDPAWDGENNSWPWMQTRAYIIYALSVGGAYQGIPHPGKRWSISTLGWFGRDTPSGIYGEKVNSWRSTYGDWSSTLDQVYGQMNGYPGDSGAIGWMLAPDGQELIAMHSGNYDGLGPNLFKQELQDDLRAKVTLLGEDPDEVETYSIT